MFKIIKSALAYYYNRSAFKKIYIGDIDAAFVINEKSSRCFPRYYKARLLKGWLHFYKKEYKKCIEVLDSSKSIILNSKVLNEDEKKYLIEYCLYIINSCIVQGGLGDPRDEVFEYNFEKVNEEDVRDFPLMIKKNNF
jgi:hypothetical protein